MSTYTCTVSPKNGAAPDDAKVHHVKDKSGRLVRFENPFLSYGPWKDVSLFRIWINLLCYRAQGKLPTPDTSNVTFPVVSPRFLPSRTGASNAIRSTWIGHATCFVEFPSGFRALFDPVFEERCSSIRPKRFTPPACKPTDFPALDAIFISHNHHDHVSYTSVKAIVHKYPHTHFFVGLVVAKWFQDSGIRAVTEMDWWDDADVVLEKTIDSKGNALKGDEHPEHISVRISFLPGQHDSLRSPLDRDRTLWGSRAVSSGGKSAWFGGDTGYRCVAEGTEELGAGFGQPPRCPQFTQIGDLRGPFDLGLIPIGAYQPRAVWSAIHASPYDAVEMFQDTKCRTALAMHWGTFALTSEPVDEPPKKLKEALKVKGLAETGLFDICAVGESREI